MQSDALASTDNFKRMIESYLSSPVVKTFLAGSLSGTCTTILFQPLDLVKTRLQCAVTVGSNPTGIVTVVTHVLRNERVVGLWKGIVPSLTRTVPGIGVYFSSLHWLRTTFGTNDPSSVESFMMGLCARSFSGACMLPFTVVKTRFESGQFHYRGMVNALSTIYKSEGTRGLYSGLAATLLRDAPFSGLYLMFYTRTKTIVRDSGLMENPQTPIVHFTCGIFAGTLASIVTQPADVVKTQMQLNPKRFSSVYSVILYVYEREGAAGFLRGLVPRCMRRALMAAMAWTVFESVMKKVGIK